MEPFDRDAAAHPPAHRLDAVAAGDADEVVSGHLASCEACMRYVSTLRDQAARFRATHDAKAFVARAGASAGLRARRALWSRAAWLTAPVAAAAVVLLVARGRPHEAPLPVLPPPAAEPESHFKGGVAVAVVRDRGGLQERLVGPFHVRADDRVRVEVSTDRGEPLEAGLLTDEGEWIPLLDASEFKAGTHYSERAARFDAAPTHATLLVGQPDDVDRARRTRTFAGLIAWRVTSEP